MRKFLTVVLVAFMLTPMFTFAQEDVEKLKADYQSVVQSFAENAESQKFLVEGFKSTNSTYRALVGAQQKLQQQAKALMDKIKALEAPPAETPDPPTGE